MVRRLTRFFLSCFRFRFSLHSFSFYLVFAPQDEKVHSFPAWRVRTCDQERAGESKSCIAWLPILMSSDASVLAAIVKHLLVLRTYCIFLQMNLYWSVRNLFLEQEALHNCLEIHDLNHPDRSYPYPSCALAAMLILAQGMCYIIF